MIQEAIMSLLLLLIILLMMQGRSCFLPAVSAEEQEADLPADALTLLAFKASLSDPLNHLASWSNSLSAGHNLSSWHGVTATNSSHSVVSISLPSCNLTGPLSPVLGNLSSLQELQLSDNNLSGPIPPQVYGLPSLISLNLSFNWLSGAVPRRFATMPHLQVLDLNTNSLTGGIPEDIANSSALLRLDLGGNSFGGPVPPQLGSLPNLLTFTASSNGLTGNLPASLGNLRKLQWFYVGYNSLDGEIPPSLGNLEDLQLLDVSNNFYITGRIPSQLGQLKSLTILRLYNNTLTGNIPPELGSLKSLQDLDLAYNNLTGDIPQELAGLTNLELIHLNFNFLTGPFPEWIADLPSLSNVYLYNNSLTGQIPQHLGKGTQLQYLDVSSNELDGSIPPDLCSGKSLIKLLLFSNQLSGPVPEGVLNCPSLIRLRLHNNMLNGSLPDMVTFPLSLQYFEISNNRLTGRIPAGLGNASSLQTILIERNQFEGELPLELANLSKLGKFHASENRFGGSFPLQLCANKPNLFSLDLAGNAFVGPIPSNLSGCPALETLYLNDNQFSGSFPLQLCASNHNLYDLNLGSNAFSGPLPTDISKCTNLQTLYLDHNHFNGSIPTKLGELPVLAYIDLSVNEFKGLIPTTLSTSRSMIALNFSYNQLSGPVPEGGVFSNLSESNYQGNPGLCGESLTGLQPCSDSLYDATTEHNSKAQVSPWLILGLCLVALLVSLACVCLLYIKCSKVFYILEQQKSCDESSFCNITMFQTSPIITAEDLESAIKEENMIGRGASGSVYKGKTGTGKPFVVKKLWARGGSEDEFLSSQSLLYDHGFMAEVEILGRIRHINIVRLICCCVTRDCDLLVYEHMHNGSLAAMLEDKAKAGTLHWDLRYKIAVDIAQSLAYLHHDCTPQILHRDIKSSNILLDSSFVAHLGDFGLARHLLNGTKQAETMSILAGSYGYIAPEYAFTLKASSKCDVYSFGVVLMELVTGRRPVDMAFNNGDGGGGQGTETLAKWVSKKMDEDGSKEGDALDLVDARLGHLPGYVKEEALWVLKVGLMCTSASPHRRPTMREVVSMLLRPRVGHNTTSIAHLQKLQGKEDLLLVVKENEELHPYNKGSLPIRW